MGQTAVAPPPARRGPVWTIGVVTLGALVSLTVGLVARHTVGSGYGSYFRLFFSDPIHLKVWFATAAAALAVVQLLLAAWIFRKLPWPRPAWVPGAHRWTGRVAFLLTLPVAYHCIFQLGFQTYSGRVLAHSLLGSALYGAFVTKVAVVRLHRFPRWVLPAAGGLLFGLLIGLWYTSAYWFFSTVGVSL